MTVRLQLTHSPTERLSFEMPDATDRQPRLSELALAAAPTFCRISALCMEKHTLGTHSHYITVVVVFTATRRTNAGEKTLTSDAANTRLHTGANTGAEAPIPSGRDKRLH